MFLLQCIQRSKIVIQSTNNKLQGFKGVQTFFIIVDRNFYLYTVKQKMYIKSNTLLSKKVANEKKM